MTTPRYKRILLKLSGEALMGDDAYGINPQTIARIVGEIKAVTDLGVEVGVVIGGGNIFRGMAGTATGMDRATADYMGMLATVMNAMALSDAMRQAGLNARVQSALNIEQVVEPYIRGKAIRYLEEGKVVIFGAGTGNPFFTTDTAAALRGSEIGAEMVLKATKVDGIYTADPKKDPAATRFDKISFDEAISPQSGGDGCNGLCPVSRPETADQRVLDLQARRTEARGDGRGRGHAGLTAEEKTHDSGTQENCRAEDAEVAGGAQGRSGARCVPAAPIPACSIMCRSITTAPMVPINQVANVTLIDARTIGVQPWEKTMVGKVEKAIRDSDLGLNPATQGELIRVPDAGADRRAPPELIKVVKHEGETAKVAIRNLRRDANSHLKDALKKTGDFRGRRAPRPGRHAEAHRPLCCRSGQDAGR